MTEQKQQKNSKNNLKSFPFPSLMKRTKDLLPSQNNLLQSGKHNQTNKIQKYFYKDLEMDISAACLHFPSVPELHIAQPSISPNPKKFRSGARHFVFFFLQDLNMDQFNNQLHLSLIFCLYTGTLLPR